MDGNVVVVWTNLHTVTELSGITPCTPNTLDHLTPPPLLTSQELFLVVWVIFMKPGLNVASGGNTCTGKTRPIRTVYPKTCSFYVLVYQIKCISMYFKYDFYKLSKYVTISMYRALTNVNLYCVVNPRTLILSIFKG